MLKETCIALVLLVTTTIAVPVWFDVDDTYTWSGGYDRDESAEGVLGDSTLANDQFAKRDDHTYHKLAKRIHSCALMRRMGLPIAMCMRGPRRVPAATEATEPRQEDSYDYLKGQWPVQHMLGGSVGKR